MCKRKYRSWLTIAYAGSWRSGTCRWWGRNGWHSWCKTLYAKSSYTGFSPTTITAITNVYQQNAKGNNDGIHPFKKYFEELQVGDQIITEKRMITSEDIDRFADLSGDHFYAHIKETDFTGTMFETTGGAWIFYHERCCRFVC